MKIVKRFQLKTVNFAPEKSLYRRVFVVFLIISICAFLRHPRAANSAVSIRIWPNFELFRVLIRIIIICKCEKDRMKNSREKVVTPFLL